MKKNICKKIFALVCAMSVVLTSLQVPFQSNAEEAGTNFADSEYADWEQVTFKDWGIKDGTYTGLMDDIKAYSLGDKELADKVFNGNFRFSGEYSHFTIGGVNDAWSGINVYSDVGDFYFPLPGKDQPIADPEVAGTSLVYKTFNLKMSYDVYDSDSDGTDDTLKLGVWFNDKLYNNEYLEISTWTDEPEPGIVIEHSYKEFLGEWFGIFVPSTGWLALESVVAEDATVDATDNAQDNNAQDNNTFNPLYVAIPVVVVIAAVVLVIVSKSKKKDEK